MILQRWYPVARPLNYHSQLICCGASGLNELVLPVQQVSSSSGPILKLSSFWSVACCSLLGLSGFSHHSFKSFETCHIRKRGFCRVSRCGMSQMCYKFHAVPCIMCTYRTPYMFMFAVAHLLRLSQTEIQLFVCFLQCMCGWAYLLSFFLFDWLVGHCEGWKGWQGRLPEMRNSFDINIAVSDCAAYSAIVTNTYENLNNKHTCSFLSCHFTV